MALAADGAMRATWQRVLFYSTLTALTSGLGALPLLWCRTIGPRNLALSNCAAAGMCLAAAVSLAMEGVQAPMADAWTRVGGGGVLGYLFIVATRAFLERNEGIKFQALAGPTAKKTLLLIVVMTAHSFAEGVGIGVSFNDRDVFGVYVSTALAIHNIPEGLAVALVLVPQGTSVGKAAAWAVLSSLPQPLMAIPAFLFVQMFGGLLPIGLGFAAAAMAHVACFELLPESRLEMSRAKGSELELFGVLGASFAAMLAVQLALHEASE
ncbi:ZIP zinc transporter-domain-containing protein [Pavlovales sp. CCMP2436]|nr:ZIP zinc transporter-domain-containing protein [Pavlovales sp. CCMP2436]